MKLDDFLNRSWESYCAITPDAPRIHALLEERGEEIVNDHLAFRTFQLDRIGRFELGRIFEAWGYERAPDVLEFPEKKLLASYWVHPEERRPKIFISELLLDKVSPELKEWVTTIARPLVTGQGPLTADALLTPGWEPVRHADYQKFTAESEYAAWTCAFGIRTNHFTVLVNRLKTVASLEELNRLLIEKGFALNSAGGVIKGTPAELLEQSSTVARKVPWRFADAESQPIMSCYYEFARRYPVPGTGRLYPGFIPKSADKIFESTYERRS